MSGVRPYRGEQDAGAKFGAGSLTACRINIAVRQWRAVRINLGCVLL
jgi:hypothetical protein